MERKVLFTGIILTICIGVIIGIVFLYSGSKVAVNPIKTVPQDAAYLIRLNGLPLAKTLTSSNIQVWSDLEEIPLVNAISKELKVIDSLASENARLNELTGSGEIYVSGHFGGGRNMHHLILFSLPPSIKEKDISDYLEKNKNSFAENYSERKYEGKSIFSVTLKSKRIIYITLCNSVLCYSGSPVLIEDAIRQSTLNVSLLDIPEFNEMISATGKNKLANIFIDFKKAGKLLSLAGNVTYSSKIRDYELMGDWAELDVNIKSDLVLLNGFTLVNSENVDLFSTLSGGKPVRLTIDKILPSSISAFIAFGISSPQESYNNYLEYLDRNGKLTRYNANLANMNSKYGIEFDKFFLSLLDNEMALAYQQENDAQSGAHYLIFKCLSGSDANRQLAEITEKVGTINNAAKSQSYSPDNSIRFNIYKLPIYPLFGRLIGDFFSVFEENYITVVDNYIVVAGSYKDASQFIYSYMLQKTLGNDEVYRDFSENLSIKSFALGYFNIPRSDGYFKRYLSDEFLNNWRSNKSAFNNVQNFGFQMSQVSNMPYLNLFLKRFGNYKGKPQTVWESLLDTTIASKPAFVINHYSKQNEIFIQDQKNNIYLINQAGRILWKQSVSEAINSEIYQIDFYKNGKLQILFSTKSQIHLIDRNGNYVEKYPIKLRSNASAGMALFDYDKNRNYRIFVPCENKQVYAYNQQGDVIDGWQFSGADHIVTNPVQHFRLAEKDFIVFADKNKTYILDRKGKDRVLVKTAFGKSKNNIFYSYNNGKIENSYLVTTDQQGQVIEVFFDGTVKTKKVGDFSSGHFFDFKDLNADGIQDYVYLDENQLFAFKSDGKKLFSLDIKEPISHRPVYYHFSHNNRKIGLVSEANEKIYLVNSNGEMYSGFPLEGKTLFSIGYFDLTSSRFNLIVGGRNNFLYNYAVE